VERAILDELVVSPREGSRSAVFWQWRRWSPALVAVVVASACGGSSETKPDGVAANGGSAGSVDSAGRAGSGVNAGAGGATAANSGGAGGTSGTSDAANGGSGGRAGGGGSTATAGTGGTAGGEAGVMGTMAGATGEPGSGAAAGASGETGSSCAFSSVAASVSTTIGTVATVTWALDGVVEQAHIDFGLDTSYGMTAPVDVGAINYATMLLGMKPSLTYHYRVSARVGGLWCQDIDRTVDTGALPNDLPGHMVTTSSPRALAGGYLISEFYQPKPFAFILDADGDYVWAYDAGLGHANRARMSPDGKYLWMVDTNVPLLTSHVVKVRMDGTDAQDLSDEFPDLEQDFLFTPDGTMYYLAWDSTVPPSEAGVKVMKHDPEGTTSEVVNLGSFFASGGNCPALQYSLYDDTLLVTDISHTALIKIARNGELVWILGGGSANSFTGDGATFTTRFNLDVLGPNHFLMFQNGTSSGTSASAVEVTLDTTQMTAKNGWQYVPDSPLNSVIFGDVQHLPNGNVLVTFSASNVIHEIDGQNTVLQKISFVDNLGYSIKLPSLYGPAPK
jgi:hypothetical protein